MSTGSLLLTAHSFSMYNKKPGHANPGFRLLYYVCLLLYFIYDQVVIVNIIGGIGLPLGSAATAEGMKGYIPDKTLCIVRCPANGLVEYHGAVDNDLYAAIG